MTREMGAVTSGHNDHDLEGADIMQYFILGTVVALLTFHSATITFAGEATDATKADAQPAATPTPPAAAPPTATTTEPTPAPAPQAANEQPATQTTDSAPPASTEEKKDEGKE
jgi:hypothetical protein